MPSKYATTTPHSVLLVDIAQAIAAKYGISVVRIHTHIGSGSDPDVWEAVSAMSLALCQEFPLVTTLNLGGGFKVGRMSYETSTDLQQIGPVVKEKMEDFMKENGRKLHLEIEPGTFLTANAGL